MERGLSRLRLHTGMLVVGALASSAVVGLAGVVQATESAPDGFACDGQIFQSAGSNQVRLYTATDREGTVSFSPLGPAVPAYNAIGVDPKTQYVFGIRQSTNQLIRINNKGSVTSVGAIAGLPVPRRGSYLVGAFDPAGDYYVMNPGPKTMYSVDVSTRKVTRTIHLTSPTLPGMADFTYSGGYLWGAGSKGAIQRIDPSTGAATNFAGKVPATPGGYGGTFTYKNGDLGFIANEGFFVRVAVAAPASAAPTFKVVSKQASARPAEIVDGAACLAAPAHTNQADLQLVKTGPTSVPVGAPVTYKITVKNNGPDTSSGWTVNDTLPSDLRSPKTSAAGCTITGSHLSCTRGRLAAGASATITVTGTAPAPAIDNTATVSGKDPDPKPSNNTSCVTTYVGPEPHDGKKGKKAC
ncbi:DUF6923 family protein [Streptomyces sp. NPDC059680]|uniref:DUF6923 family protein n=1 Tax=Streptomyces sp. NPDC059680 TaxID=3346904 RepID=UPI0036CF22BC